MKTLITIPVYNEEKALADSIGKLNGFLDSCCNYECEILIADNGSTDRTLQIANSLVGKYKRLRVSHLDLKGRGRAVKKAWCESGADILSYMDADLSTELEAFPKLVDALTSGGFDLGTGSRLLNSGTTTRSWRRELTSRCYNVLVKALLGTRFSDAQCGFKAITRRAAEVLLPLIEDDGWFFDTELLTIGEKFGYQIFDLPVTWVENRNTHVKIFRTAVDDVRGLLHLRKRLIRMGQSVTRFEKKAELTRYAGR